MSEEERGKLAKETATTNAVKFLCVIGVLWVAFFGGSIIASLIVCISASPEFADGICEATGRVSFAYVILITTITSMMCFGICFGSINGIQRLKLVMHTTFSWIRVSIILSHTGIIIVVLILHGLACVYVDDFPADTKQHKTLYMFSKFGDMNIIYTIMSIGSLIVSWFMLRGAANHQLKNPPTDDVHIT